MPASALRFVRRGRARAACALPTRPSAPRHRPTARVAEHVRVAAHHLVADRGDDVAEIERARLLRHPRVEHDLQQQVAELVAQCGRSLRSIASATSYASSIVYGAIVCEVLLDVPRAAAVRDRAGAP